MQPSSEKETIVVIGYGWVGQANALALAILGYDVFFYDVVYPSKHYGQTHANIYDRVKPLSDPLEKDGEDTWYIISVGDRVSEDGVQDISLIRKATESVKNAHGGVVLRSTVLPQNLKGLHFDYYMPEFLHEKRAVEECMNPHFFVVGNNNSKKSEPSFFADWESRAYRTFRGKPEQASYIKYLSNIWNSLRIAFVNEFGDLIAEPKDKERITQIEEIIDFIFERKSYVRYGRGYSGHCLPKDTHAFLGMHQGKANVGILAGIHESNLAHQALERQYGGLPEWFSSWAYGATAGERGRNLANALWRRANAVPPVRMARSRLGFIVKVIERAIPTKTLPELQQMWDTLALENARFFVNPKTKSWRQVTEFELRETGLADYEHNVSGDTLLKKRLGNMKQKTALDLGCGIGRMTEFFAPDFYQVYAVDFSKEMTELARRRLFGLSNVTVSENDGQSIPLPDRSIDLCFSQNMFQYLREEGLICQYLQEIKRILKPGGTTKVQLRTGKGTYKWKYSYGVPITEEKARILAGNADLKVLSLSPEPYHLWLTLERPA